MEDKKIKISVITPTIRPEGLKQLQECLQGQTFKDFEWLVEVGLPDNGHDLNAAFNRMIKRAKGELIVFYEDYTTIKPDGLERFWKAYQEFPDTCFTSPLAKVVKFGDTPHWDWRAHKQNEEQIDYTDCRWDTCELDWGAIPRKVLIEIGGFDEELDQFWSCDNVNVGCRADLAGYKFKCVFTNPAIAIDHDAIMNHPFRGQYKPSFNTDRMNQFRNGLKINYLTT